MNLIMTPWDTSYLNEDSFEFRCFVNSKKMVDILDDYLYNLKLPTTSVHSDRTQREREDAL